MRGHTDVWSLHTKPTHSYVFGGGWVYDRGPSWQDMHYRTVTSMYGSSLGIIQCYIMCSSACMFHIMNHSHHQIWATKRSCRGQQPHTWNTASQWLYLFGMQKNCSRTPKHDRPYLFHLPESGDKQRQAMEFMWLISNQYSHHFHVRRSLAMVWIPSSLAGKWATMWD